MAPEHEVIDGRYEILREVSAGRRASLLQGLDLVHQRRVALKVYPVDAGDRDELLAEGQVLMATSAHPGLPTFRHDFFTLDGSRYVMVMDWVEGVDLQQLLEDHGDPGLPLAEVLDLLASAAAVLDHLHAHDPPIVHGDVKPANLLRVGAGAVVLVDFDIAGVGPGKGRVGTVGYVAPEVAAGEKPTAASDVFGLAATAVALLSGRPPSGSAPSYPGIDPSAQAQLARVVRTSLAVDPLRRHRSAGELVQRLRSAARGDDPSGVVALLAAEVADATRLWHEDPEEMRAAMSRVRDVRDEIVEQRGGRVVTSMNEGDRTIAVFREASAAALAALAINERLAREPFPPGIDIRLRSGLAVGEALVSDGIYSGAVVDQVLVLRSLAAPGSIVSFEATAQLLLDLVGHDVGIVPLGTPRSGGHTGAVFGLTRPGAEATAALAAPIERESSSPAAPAGLAMAGRRSPPRLALAATAALSTPALVSLTIGGAALIVLLVLVPEVGYGAAVAAVLVLATLALLVSFGGHYRRGRAAWADSLRSEVLESRAAAERAAVHERLEAGYARLPRAARVEGQQLLQRLGDELDANRELLARHRDREHTALPSLLPELIHETHRHGISALSDALELLEFAHRPQRTELQDELDDIEGRLDRDAYADPSARARDEHRARSHRQILERHERSRARASELLFEAEQCLAALTATHVELASISAVDDGEVMRIVRSLEETIRHVSDVQAALRALDG